ESYEQEVRDAFTNAGLGEHVSWIGHRSDLREVQASCSITLSLTQVPESFGKTTLEALALGKPVAGYDHGGVKEQLQAFLPEGLIPVGDTKSMATLLEQWYYYPPIVLQEIPPLPYVMTPQEAAITLNLIPGLGSIKIQRLLEFFGSPEIVLHAPARLLQEVKGIGNDLATSIISWKTTTNALKEIDFATQAKVSITTLFDPEYPTILRTITDPPIVLYSYGHWLPMDGEKSIAVVGSRMATHYGRMIAQKFSYSLAEAGITIISGLARGIDSTAHHAALTAGGRTLAIIGSGLNRLYPEENKALADMIVDGHGAVISEFPMNLAPSKSTFPMRNRIVSAWSQATLVIEASKRSGALITANSAN
ncbi:MAG: DNA-processing protein DprA, partial [Akkermansia sp.]